MMFKKKRQSDKKKEIERKNKISVNMPGSGLPYYQKNHLLYLKENSNDSVVVIDADGSLSPFVDLIGGEIICYEDVFLYIDYLLTSLDSSNVDENAIFLANILELLSGTVFSQEQQSKLICYIDEKFAQNEKLSLSSMLAYMQLTLPKEIEWICKITPEKQKVELFNSRIVSLNLSKCPKILLTAAYLLSLKMSFDIVSSNGEKWQYTWLSCNIDEIVKHPKTCSYLSSISKRMRTHWGVCSYYTHSLLDVYNMAPEILCNIVKIFTYEPSEDDSRFICENYLDSSVDLRMPGGIEPYLDCIFDMALQKKEKQAGSRKHRNLSDNSTNGNKLFCKQYRL